MKSTTIFIAAWFQMSTYFRQTIEVLLIRLVAISLCRTVTYLNQVTNKGCYFLEADINIPTVENVLWK